jgi:FlaA1/EpsC-like NDP-sugar epimerase
MKMTKTTSPKLQERLREIIENRVVLVTGGSGSIGSEIVRQLIPYRPRYLRIYSRDEYKQSLLRSEFRDHPFLRYLLGDVRDLDRLKRAVEDVDVLFHAAALKRVEATEYDPFEAVQTNVIGTQNVIVAALESGVDRVVSISTDKAVNVTSTMGATKLLAERLISWASFYRREPHKVFCSVRFGNVLDSRGSVIPLWREQIRRGEPVTLTHPEMRRFFMSIPEAVHLVLQGAARAEGGEIFVLRMKSVFIRDLADVIIEEMAPQFGRDPKDVSIRLIGVTPGEKLDEDLLAPGEIERTFYVDEDMGVIVPPHRFKEFKGKSLRSFDGYATGTNSLTREELRAYLKEAQIV